jgi:hypothetical protein
MLRPAKLPASPPQGTSRLADRRFWVRYPLPGGAGARLFDTRARACQFAGVVNFSTGGIALLLEEPVPLDTRFKVEVEHQGRFHMLKARVVNVQQTGRGSLHGCAFTRSLAPSQLRALLGE